MTLPLAEGGNDEIGSNGGPVSARSTGSTKAERRALWRPLPTRDIARPITQTRVAPGGRGAHTSARVPEAADSAVSSGSGGAFGTAEEEVEYFKQRWTRIKVLERKVKRRSQEQTIRLVFTNCDSKTLDIGVGLSMKEVGELLAKELGREVTFSWRDGHDKVLVADDEEWKDLCHEVEADKELNGQMDVELVSTAPCMSPPLRPISALQVAGS